MFCHEKRLIIRNFQEDGDKWNIRFFDTNNESIYIEVPEDSNFEMSDPLSVMVQKPEDTNAKR